MKARSANQVGCRRLLCGEAPNAEEPDNRRRYRVWKSLYARCHHTDPTRKLSFLSVQPVDQP